MMQANGMTGTDTAGFGQADTLRAASTHVAAADRLGPLQDLPGFWEGVGFSLIARPNFGGGNHNGIFLQLNLLRETIEFTPIGSPVFNRGSAQGDIAIYGVTYLHRVTDAVTGGGLHVEPGMWLNIPPTTAPDAKGSIARLATVPHGNSICSVGFSEEAVFDGLPTIPPANTIPFNVGEQPPPAGTKNPFVEYDLGIPSAFRSNPLPPEITQAVVDDPNVLVRKMLQRQAEQGCRLTKILRLITQTGAKDGIDNIPFITKNADASGFFSVFAIESVQGATGDDFLQLQYSQTVLLNFGGMSFPHVTCGTLIKAF